MSPSSYFCLALYIAIAASMACLGTAFVGSRNGLSVARLRLQLSDIKRDANGYEIKPKDWFNGLSLDPGGSLTDPRAVPEEPRKFAEAVKSGSKKPSFQETIDMIDKHYNYFEVFLFLLLFA